MARRAGLSLTINPIDLIGLAAHDIRLGSDAAPPWKSMDLEMSRTIATQTSVILDQVKLRGI